MIREQLREAIAAALLAARQQGTLALDAMPAVGIELVADEGEGDYTCGVALGLAREEGLAPREIAGRIVARLPQGQGLIARATVSDDGTIHFSLSTEALQGIVAEVRRRREQYGRNHTGAGRQVQIEFVSADPNAPLHLGHGRAAALGDVLARLLEWTGWRVSREYYVNDAPGSAQMLDLGRSLFARYRQALGCEVVASEDVHEGGYLGEIAREVAAQEGDRYLQMPEEESALRLGQVAMREVLAAQRRDLDRFGVRFDVWFSERALHESGAVMATVEALRANGRAYDAEGGVWFRSTAFGDEKDRVLVRSTGAPTYLAADAAYHRDKFARGFDRVIDVWGPEYEAYVARTKAVVAALGIDPNRLEILIHQAVRLLKGGDLVRSSRRAGDIIPLSDLLDEVANDAARFFFLLQPASAPLDFDADLARQQTPENPLFLLRTAWERMNEALERVGEGGAGLPPADAVPPVAMDAQERRLVRKLGEFPGEMALAAEAYQPHCLAHYARDLSAAFLDFRDAGGVSGEGVAPETAAARLATVDACRVVLGSALEILGIAL